MRLNGVALLVVAAILGYAVASGQAQDAIRRLADLATGKARPWLVVDNAGPLVRGRAGRALKRMEAM